ncbi:hypothetical protein ACIQ1S_07435 [Streptomyces griseus]|uniref:hypothetical protein n=1 Tax=Streptomyces griseus TaxID=1911 RepID=UPI003805523D
MTDSIRPPDDTTVYGGLRTDTRPRPHTTDADAPRRLPGEAGADGAAPGRKTTEETP